MVNPHAVIIGAGFTGVATAHDLALRGFKVTVVDRGGIASATSGRTHGLLHSGARYAVKDLEAAVECIEENMVLRKIVPEAIESNEGLFIGLSEEDLAYADGFKRALDAAGIAHRSLTADQALRLEKNLNPALLTAVAVPDGTFDPLRFALSFAATAKFNGAEFLTFREVKEFVRDDSGRIAGIDVWERNADRRTIIRGDIIINAAGPWAGEVAAIAGAVVSIKPSPGVMVAYEGRLVDRAINRLAPPGDGDIILPQRRMVVVGTTSFSVEDLDYVPVYREQVRKMLETGSQMVPALRSAKERGAYMAIRPLIDGDGSGRKLTRTFRCFDHQEADGIDGFVSITGGKATTLRLMAEKTADLVCRKLGIVAPCRTRETPLLPYRKFYRT